MPDNNLKISEDVIAVVAGVAASEVDGVAELTSGGLVGGIMQNIGLNKASKGVKVTIADNCVIIDLHIIIYYGFKIPEIAEAVQSSVSSEVETMTGMDNIIVNINVDGIKSKEEKIQ